MILKSVIAILSLTLHFIHDCSLQLHFLGLQHNPSPISIPILWSLPYSTGSPPSGRLRVIHFLSQATKRTSKPFQSHEHLLNFSWRIIFGSDQQFCLQILSSSGSNNFLGNTRLPSLLARDLYPLGIRKYIASQQHKTKLM